MIIANIKIEISRDGKTHTLEFESPDQLFPHDRVTCKICGMYCSSIGDLVVHLADNCSESATAGALLARLERYGYNTDSEVSEALRCLRGEEDN